MSTEYCESFAGTDDTSRTKRPMNTKIGGKVVHLTCNNAHQFQGQRSKVKVTRPTNAVTGSASYLRKGKACELQTWYTDGGRRPAPPTSAVWPSRSKIKVARLRDVSDRCWPISRERNVLETPKLVGRLSASRANNAHHFQGQKSKSRSPRRLMLRLEVCHIFWTERPTNFKLGVQMEHEDPYCRDGPRHHYSKVNG